MKPPTGKHKPMIYGRSPWKSLDADHTRTLENSHQTFIHKTPQPEIDVCLNCSDSFCTGNECKRIKKCRHEAFIKRKEKYKREYPPGFKEDAFAGFRNVDLCVKYNLTKYMVEELKKGLGLYPQKPNQDLDQFKKDALAGMSQNALSAKHHMSKERIKRLFKEYGIDRTKKE